MCWEDGGGGGGVNGGGGRCKEAEEFNCGEGRERVNLLMGRNWLIGVLLPQLLSLVSVCSYVSGVHATMAAQLLGTKLLFIVSTEI